MAVHAHFAVAVEVVEQDVIAGELVLVGRDLLAEQGELGSPLPTGLPLASVKSPKTWSYVRFSLMMYRTCLMGLRRRRGPG